LGEKTFAPEFVTMKVFGRPRGPKVGVLSLGGERLRAAKTLLGQKG